MTQLKLNMQPVRTCGKRRYYRIEEAELHRYSVATVERLLSPSSPPITVYHCPECNAYHVGHSS